MVSSANLPLPPRSPYRSAWRPPPVRSQPTLCTNVEVLPFWTGRVEKAYCTTETILFCIAYYLKLDIKNCSKGVPSEVVSVYRTGPGPITATDVRAYCHIFV
eukprot:767139-Hanusia_phi.AAC.4